jgi:phosphatidate cytidylyltransferase
MKPPGGEIRTRIWIGTLMATLTAAMLVADQWHRFRDYHPFLLLFFVVLAPLSCAEMLALLGPERRPVPWLCQAGVLLMLLGNWPAHLARQWDLTAWPDPWQTMCHLFALVVLAAFCVEMATYREPGGVVARIALTVWIVAYLGVLPSFLAQLRWLSTEANRSRGVTAIALAIFVPKACDIGAYFTGRLLGRTPMTPALSPKKTWEGLVGGLALAILVAVAMNYFSPVLPNALLAAGFGFTVAVAGVLGDLAESLVKRDCRRKDASQVVPGFGGVLDVVDSILFAAPVAYWFLVICTTWSEPRP